MRNALGPPAAAAELRGASASFFDARGLDFFRRCAKMALNFAFFFLGNFLAEDIFVLRVGLRKIVEAETLREFHVAAAFPIALDELIDAPLDFGGRTFPAAAEILVVFDLELADVFFESGPSLRQWCAMRGRCPRTYHARSMEQNRQPEEWAAMRIRYRELPGILRWRERG